MVSCKAVVPMLFASIAKAQLNGQCGLELTAEQKDYCKVRTILVFFRLMVLNRIFTFFSGSYLISCPLLVMKNKGQPTDTTVHCKCYLKNKGDF